MSCLYVVFYNRFTVCMVYYGLSLGVGGLSSSLYIGFALSGIVEIPSNFFSFFTLEKLVCSLINMINNYIMLLLTVL